MITDQLLRRTLLKGFGVAGLASMVSKTQADETATGMQPTIVHTRELLSREPNKNLWHLHQTPISRTNLVQMRGESVRHIHPDAAHSLYVISGELTARVGDESFSLREGDFISIPAGVPHGYVVPDGKTALLISMDAPPYDPAKTVPSQRDKK